MVSLRVLWPVWVLGLVGCGGGKQEPVPPSASVAPQATVAQALPPLGPVPAPAELFAVARLPNASKTADTGIAWAGLPVHWQMLLDKAVPGLGRAAMLDAPIDFAAMLDPTSAEEPRVEWAFAVGAPSTDAAVGFLQAQGARVTPEPGGAYRAQMGSDLTCMIVRALGAAPARVVCSDESVNADALAPYMSCGMPSESFGPSELHAHVTAEPFRRRYGSQVTLVRTVGVPFLLRELGLDHPKFDRALRDVLYGLADEVIALAYDLDRIDFDATLAPGGSALDLATTLSLSGQRSWWAQTVVHSVTRGSPAPDAFWKLPGESTAAGYSSVGDSERVRSIAASLRELLDGWLDYHKLSDKRRTPLVEALEQVITTSAATANASLPDEAAPKTAERAHGFTPESLKSAIGQHLFVVDRGGDHFTRFASELVKSLGDRAFREHLTQTKVLSAAELPLGRERGPKLTKGLPPQTKVYELQIPHAALASAALATRPHGGKGASVVTPPEKAGETVSVVLIAMPDGPLTWFALGTDEPALEARLAQVKAGTGGTLAQRDGLAALKTESALSAGFSSLSSLVEGIRGSLGKAGSSLPSSALLPHKGESPVLWHVTSSATGPRVTAQARVPRELVEDVVAMAATSAAAGLGR